MLEEDNTSIDADDRLLADTATVIIHLQLISNPFTENFVTPFKLVTYLITN